MIIKNILIGLQQVHQQNLLHRDIKPENIVLGGKKRPDPTSQEITEAITDLRIIDFGFSSETKRSKWDQLESNVGTTLFMAPEQISTRTYGKKIDIYACGITMFYLLAGHHPLYRFTDTTLQFHEKVANIGPKRWKYPSFFSKLAIDLIQRLCGSSVSTRYEARTALDHPWITRDFNSPIPANYSDDYQHIL